VHDERIGCVDQVKHTTSDVNDLSCLTPSHSFANVQPSPSDYGSLGDTMDPTTLWPASMDNPNMHNEQPPMPDQQPPLYGHQSPIHSQRPSIHSHHQSSQSTLQPSNQLPAQKSSVNPNNNGNSPFHLAPRPTLTAPPRSSSTLPSTTSHNRTSSSQASTPSSTTSASIASPHESDKTRRARYAANQRHSKAQKARHDSAQNETPNEADARAAERKQRHREKNKVAAAKCRSRQRKQVQTIQEKGARLGEKNAELKAMIQELRGELNELRSMALGHQECNCHVARYNHGQAERVVAEYRETCLTNSFGGFGGLHEQRSFAQVQ
jgi:hypothetical protein